MNYSPSANSFFDGDPMPTDVVVVTAAQLMAAQLCWQAGGSVAPGADGYPVTSYPALALAAVKAARRCYIDEQRDLALAGLVVTYNGNTFQADPASVGRLTSATLAGASGITLPANFAWRSADNRNVPFVQSDLVALGAQMLLATNAVFQRSWSLKAAVDAAVDAPTIFAITW